MHIRKLSDEKLLALCRKFGEAARLWRQRFIGLLPEVNRRRLYEKKAAKILLNLAKNFAGFRRSRFALRSILKKNLKTNRTYLIY